MQQLDVKKRSGNDINVIPGAVYIVNCVAKTDYLS